MKENLLSSEKEKDTGQFIKSPSIFTTESDNTKSFKMPKGRRDAIIKIFKIIDKVTFLIVEIIMGLAVILSIHCFLFPVSLSLVTLMLILFYGYVQSYKE